MEAKCRSRCRQQFVDLLLLIGGPGPIAEGSLAKFYPGGFSWWMTIAMRRATGAPAELGATVTVADNALTPRSSRRSRRMWCCLISGCQSMMDTRSRAIRQPPIADAFCSP